MKKIIISTLAVSTLIVGLSSMNSCSKVEDTIDEITIPVPITIPFDVETEIPFAVTTESIKYPAIPLNLDLDAKIRAQFNGATIDNVKSAKLSSFVVNFVSSSNSDSIKLDKVQDAKIYIKTPTLAETEIATVVNNVSPTALNFTPTADKELMEYLKSKDVSIALELKGTELEPVVTQMKIRINSDFKIQVGL
ncbi:hypothetical protein [Epilithonimonas sp.]|uniref:hypothetical protein n=1 Tax=Epilithonimonas sp. TaxID=2894511 RepID=UPI002FDE1A54